MAIRIEVGIVPCREGDPYPGLMSIIDQVIRTNHIKPYFMIYFGQNLHHIQIVTQLIYDRKITHKEVPISTDMKNIDRTHTVHVFYSQRQMGVWNPM